MVRSSIRYGATSLGMDRKCSIILTGLVDLGFGIGVCGKDGQAVLVADAQPTIRIKQLTVGGPLLRNFVNPGLVAPARVRAKNKFPGWFGC